MSAEDLIPLNKRTKAEQKKIQSAGGRASGEARRARKTLKDIMSGLLEMEVRDTKSFNKVANMGFDIEEIDNATLLVVALFKRACLGDVAAIKEVRNLIGEDTTSDVMAKLDSIIEATKDQAND